MRCLMSLLESSMKTTLDCFRDSGFWFSIQSFLSRVLALTHPENPVFPTIYPQRRWIHAFPEGIKTKRKRKRPRTEFELGPQGSLSMTKVVTPSTFPLFFQSIYLSIYLSIYIHIYLSIFVCVEEIQLFIDR